MNLRSCAAQILSLVLTDGISLTAALTSSLPKIKDIKDRAFVQALCYGVIRHYFALAFILGKLLSKPLKQKDFDIKALLLIGIYQLQYMRVKSHAAVSETVAASKHKPWAKGLINAVLRQYLRDNISLIKTCDADLEASHNHPHWIIKAFEDCWPIQFKQVIAANNAAPPLALRVNLLKCTRAEFIESLTEQGISAQISEICESAVLLEQAIPVEQIPGFNQGFASVQDIAAQQAAFLLDLATGQRVLDLCAAPGGKTAALLEKQPDIALLAVDIDAERLKRVTENLQRLNLSAQVLAADATQINSWGHGLQFDRILLDAPCSAFGVIRRHPDIKLLRRETDIAVLQDLQAKILLAAWQKLAPGGILLYVTCSILKQENEYQIANFLNQHPDAIELPINVNWGEKRAHGRQILTGDQHMDGFYYAKLSKMA